MAGIASTIVGGIKMKYDIKSWIVLSGILMIVVSLMLASLFMGLGGILSSYMSIPPIIIVIGLACVVIGALSSEK